MMSERGRDPIGYDAEVFERLRERPLDGGPRMPGGYRRPAPPEVRAVNLTLASTWWVYTHDLSGDIIHDYGNFADRLAAELVAVTILDTAGFDMDTMCVRLVDATDPGDAKTIWIAAPMSYIMQLPKE